MTRKVLILFLLTTTLLGCMNVKKSSPVAITANKAGVENRRCVYKIKLTNTNTRSKSRIEWVMADLFVKDANGVEIGRESMFLKTSLKPGDSALFNEKVRIAGHNGTQGCKKAVMYSIDVKKISYH